MVSVPNVVGLSQAAATSELERVGLASVVSGASCSSCLVTSTDPAAGVTVAQGSTVTLYVDVGVAY